jgi:VanZ like family
VRLRVLPLAVAVIILGTAIPIELRMPVPWSMSFDPWDFLINFALYLPLGLCWWRRPIVVGVILGTLLSASIEVLQLRYFGRQGALCDVVANALGVACGVLSARWSSYVRNADPTWIRVGGLTGATAVIGALVLLVAWVWPVRSSKIANWDGRFDLQLGNESTSDRPWRGTITTLILVPEPLSSPEIRAMSSLANADRRVVLAGRPAYVLPLPIAFDGGMAKKLPAEAARSFLRLAMERDAFTIIATIIPANVTQRGPARIVSFSRDQFNRNFDLGQEEDRIVFRVRTPVSGPNGMDPHVETPSVLKTDKPTTVVATFDGAVARVHIDGQAIGRQDLAAAGCVLPFLCGSDLPLAAGLFGALMAIVAVAIGKPRSRSNRIVLIVLAGLTSAALLRSLAVDRGSFLYGWSAPLVALLGAAIVGLSSEAKDEPYALSA